MSQPSYVVGLDNGGTANKFTVMRRSGEFLIDRLIELPSRVTEGPAAAIDALAEAFEAALTTAGVDRAEVIGVGFDTPGPATADGVISSRGGTNFAHPDWGGFDVRTALEDRLGLPVVYSNDGNAAALYAHHQHFGAVAGERSSVSAIVGTGLGGGVIESGRIVRGAAGMAGELGHVHIPMHGLLEDGQPAPCCNCGFEGDAESVASLTGIRNNLLPYWLTRYPDHELNGVDPLDAAKRVRGLGERGDELALHVFEQ
ncbi:MAG: ROK family protein, partial [Ilumatobacteraceae bacterium]